MINTKNRVIDKREAGYFSPASHNYAVIDDVLGKGLTKPFVDFSKTLMSGKWFPGRAYLTDTVLSFEATPLSRSGFHRPDLIEWTLPLDEIEQISTRQGLAYAIIDIIDIHGDIKEIRCFRSNDFIASINKARENMTATVEA